MTPSTASATKPFATNSPASSTARTGGSSDRAFNFNAGPSYLPEEVIRQIQEDIWNFKGSGLGIMEHSHRAKVYDEVIVEAEAEIRSIANVPRNYRILFMTGGSSSQNFIVPTNLLGANQTADHIVTGYWGQRSYDDAHAVAKPRNATINLAATSADTNHTYIPAASQTRFTPNAAYVHFTSNNTIFGTQWRNADGSERLPASPPGIPLVCDMCSDIYSRPTDISKFGLIYASAQKNLGTTGATIVIVRDDLIERADPALPRMLQYRTFAKDVSMPNTPPAFAIYTVGLMAKWIKAQGGLPALHARNLEKAQLVYDALDATSDFWIAHARKEDRSLMNIVFRARAGEALDQRFTAEAKAHGMDGLAGHRAAGGMRASTYNAFPKAGCEALAQFIKDFARRNG
ncbi:MAG: 3-phosphoserine/phosphohydroxythreonine transaminase [Phycisphaerales bacterium]|nr:3-phosphoserine/phosphohydroxythreonine transaminase [Phycisphaerales bacterium]